MRRMVILTAEQMRRIDERAEREHGIAPETLMDNAGREIALALLRRRPDLASIRTLILCGKGNNGGDGITAARHLAARGAAVRTVLLGRGADLKGAAAWAHRRAAAAGVRVEEVADEEGWRALRRELAEHDVIVDALLGTGARGPAAGRIREAIEAINGAGCEVVALDVPSGLDGSSPSVPGPCVEADATIALAALKVALVFPPAARRAGAVEVVDIGIPAAATEAEGADLHYADAALASGLLPERDPESHKGHYGHVLVVAGSRGKSGAAVLMARACLRSGAGLVTVAAPASAQPIVAAGAPEIMTEPLPETAAGALDRAALAPLRDLLGARDVLAIGPGLGTDPATAEVVGALAGDPGKPAILDADALNVLAEGGRWRGASGTGGSGPPRVVLTPHPGEAGRLLGVTAREVQADRLGAARRIARASGACVLLKGHRTITAHPGGAARVNATGNPGMATGGSGDVLAGIAAAWLAQGLDAFDAASLAAHVHGLAGDLAARDLGEISLTAGDIVERLPRAYLALGRDWKVR
jgi:NAD(P)H-hydrate epimerase